MRTIISAFAVMNFLTPRPSLARKRQSVDIVNAALERSGSLRTVRRLPTNRAGAIATASIEYRGVPDQTPIPSTRFRWLKYSISATESHPATDAID